MPFEEVVVPLSHHRWAFLQTQSVEMIWKEEAKVVLQVLEMLG